MGILDRWNQYRERKKRQRQKDALLAELEIPGRLKRVAVLATVSVNECMGS